MSGRKLGHCKLCVGKVMSTYGERAGIETLSQPIGARRAMKDPETLKGQFPNSRERARQKYWL
jgi:hypothetical protein